MTSLAEVLSWKFDSAPGMRTREKLDGSMEIFDWPVDALGTEPTAENIQSWTEEYKTISAFAELRKERNVKLTETDWVITMHKELGTNIPSAWKDYRKALRDLPANTADPTDITWPTKPS